MWKTCGGQLVEVRLAREVSKLSHGPELPQLGRQVRMLLFNDLDIDGTTGPRIGRKLLDQGSQPLVAIGWKCMVNYLG